MSRPTHWCHGVSVSGPVDPSGCCADQPGLREPVERLAEWLYGRSGGIFWRGETTWQDRHREEARQWFAYADMLARVSGCWRTEPTHTSIAAGFRAQQDTEAADRLAKGLRGERG